MNVHLILRQNNWVCVSWESRTMQQNTIGSLPDQTMDKGISRYYVRQHLLDFIVEYFPETYMGICQFIHERTVQMNAWNQIKNTTTLYWLYMICMLTSHCGYYCSVCDSPRVCMSFRLKKGYPKIWTVPTGSVCCFNMAVYRRHFTVSHHWINM